MNFFSKQSIIFVVILFSVTQLAAAEYDAIKSPQQIQKELDEAENDFEIAQKMFIPWYTGPLITGSSKNTPKGHINIQPYLFLKWSYGVYDNERHYSSVADTFTVNPLLVFQRGILDWLDITIQPQASFKYNQGASGASFNDLGVTLGFQLYKETPYIPGVRFVYTEIFPTGSFTDLQNPLDGVGSGAFQSVLGLNFGKVLWFLPLHPMALRLTTNVQIPTNRAKVFNVNAYGGGEGTDGSVLVGSSFNIDVGYEVSLTQKWVVSLDVAYSLSGKSSFRGFTGVTSSGLPLPVGSPVSDSLSLSPALEYNVSDTGGFIGGAWFTVAGRNSSGFAALVLSYTQLF